MPASASLSMNFTDITMGAALVERGGNAIDRPDRDRGDDRGPAHAGGGSPRLADARRLPSGSMGVRRIALCNVGVAPAHVVEHRTQIGPQRLEPGRFGRCAAGHRIDRIVLPVEDEDVIVLEERLQPGPDALLAQSGSNLTRMLRIAVSEEATLSTSRSTRAP